MTGTIVEAAGSFDTTPYRGDCMNWVNLINWMNYWDKMYYLDELEVFLSSSFTNVDSRKVAIFSTSTISPSCKGSHQSTHSRSRSPNPSHPCIPDQHMFKAFDQNILNCLLYT